LLLPPGTTLPKLNEHQRRVAIERLAAGKSARAIARDMGARTPRSVT